MASINTARQSRHMIHKTMTLNSIETELFLPEMSASSELFSDDQRKLLYRHLPPRVQGATWQLRFSSGAQVKSTLVQLIRFTKPVLAGLPPLFSVSRMRGPGLPLPPRDPGHGARRVRRPALPPAPAIRRQVCRHRRVLALHILSVIQGQLENDTKMSCSP